MTTPVEKTEGEKRSVKMSLLTSQEERKRTCRYYSENLRHYRKMHGLNQRELADAVGTIQRHISEIENGKAEVSWTLMLALSTVFVVDLQVPEDGMM